ncbi:MAG TPA: hypothetical protein DCD98_02090 [Syntrophomonas sp.]|nr:hypothetical protein [Syntrophomonas sp.]
MRRFLPSIKPASPVVKATRYKAITIAGATHKRIIIDAVDMHKTAKNIAANKGTVLMPQLRDRTELPARPV